MTTERSAIIAEMTRIRTRINKTRRNMKDSDAGLRSLITRGIEMDERLIRDLKVRLLDFPA